MSDFTLIFDWNFTRKMVMCSAVLNFLSVSVIVWQSSSVSSTNNPHVMTHRLLRPKITAKVKFKLLFCQFNSTQPNLPCCKVFFWLVNFFPRQEMSIFTHFRSSFSPAAFLDHTSASLWEPFCTYSRVSNNRTYVRFNQKESFHSHIEHSNWYQKSWTGHLPSV